NGIKILEKFPKGKPWYFQVNFVCPHEPWDITKKMKKSWKNVPFPPPNRGKENKIDLDVKIRQNYAAMIENIDRNMGLLIEEIKKRGELDNTIIIYSSDHGEMLGDFGKYGKSMPKRGSISIPLILSGPGMKKGIYSDKLVELQDLTSTIIEYSGLSMEEAKDSISLKPLLEGKDTIHRKYQISAITRINKTKEYYPWKTIIDGRYKLIMKQEFEENKKKRYQLYSLEKDPWENNDIVDENPEIVEDLQNKIIS
ncbi:MAG: sulfatase-like hydrolase/transferase, partial [archaeon]|nr:sulfatase-like hydrolase/transferase [archaeon]